MGVTQVEYLGVVLTPKGVAKGVEGAAATIALDSAFECAPLELVEGWIKGRME